MLSDRNYMGNPFKNSQDKARSGLKCVFILLGINVLMYFLLEPPTKEQMYQYLLGNPSEHVKIYNLFLLTPDGIKHFYLWQLITTMFMHGSIGHLFMNMFALFMFGTMVAPIMGMRRFLWMYMLSGIAGNLLWLAFNFSSGGGILGASGAVFGILMTAAMLQPDREVILLLLPFPMKVKTLVIIYAILETVSQFSNAQGNIAHLGHLGGLIGAYLYLKFAYNYQVQWDPFQALWKKAGLFKGMKPRKGKGWKVKSYDVKDYQKSDGGYKDGMVTQKELDRILDKISEHTINSLTEEERNTLKRAREQMKSQKR